MKVTTKQYLGEVASPTKINEGSLVVTFVFKGITEYLMILGQVCKLNKQDLFNVLSVGQKGQ